MKSVLRFVSSSLGKKYLMAISGLALVAFAFGHMMGNLQIFLGPNTFNSYAAILKASPELLWMARLALLAMVAVHIYCAVTLTLENRAARPDRYAVGSPYKASLASLTMGLSGTIVLAFIIFHLAHFTVRLPLFEFEDALLNWEHPAWKGQYDNVYAMVIKGFLNPFVSGFYIVSMGLLCLHLSHGIQSMFQSLGLNRPQYAPFLRRLSQVGSLALFLGFSSIPIAVLVTGGNLPGSH